MQIFKDIKQSIDREIWLHSKTLFFPYFIETDYIVLLDGEKCRWLTDNVGPYYWRTKIIDSNSGRIKLKFRNKTDLMAYKLRFDN